MTISSQSKNTMNDGGATAGVGGVAAVSPNLNRRLAMIVKLLLLQLVPPTDGLVVP
jgi:hypothetical protein